MDPTLRKRMIICTPFGKFINGEQHGVMSKARLRALADNFKKHPRPVPVYAMGDHVANLDDRLPDGWVEGLEVDAEGRLIGDVKMQGIGAEWVLDDRIRLASIGTVQGKNPDGSAQGEILQHVLLTNDAFDKQANIQIAAALAKGAELYAHFTTALNESQEAMMADKSKDDLIAELKEENAALKAATPDEKAAASLKESQTLLAEKIREVAELTASNENLKADVEKFKSPAAIEDLNQTVAMQARQLKAEKIRRLVKSGVDSGQFNRALVGDPRTGYEHPSDEMVLSWFKGSAFRNSMERLDVMLDTMPKQRLGRTFSAGEGLDPVAVSLNDEEKGGLVNIGAKPEHVVAAMKSKSLADYRAATAAKE